MLDNDEKQKLIDGVLNQVRGLLTEEKELIAAGCNSAKSAPFKVGINIQLTGPMKELKSKARLSMGIAKSSTSSIETIDVLQMDLIKDTGDED